MGWGVVANGVGLLLCQQMLTQLIQLSALCRWGLVTLQCRAVCGPPQHVAAVRQQEVAVQPLPDLQRSLKTCIASHLCHPGKLTMLLHALCSKFIV